MITMRKFMYHIKPLIALERFSIVTHIYPASLSIKTCLDKKLTTFFNSKTKVIYLNSLIVYERKLKIKVTSLWTCWYLRQQLFTNKDFCIKTRLCNYFITTNPMGLSKANFNPLKSSAKNAKNNYRKTARSFLPAV